MGNRWSASPERSWADYEVVESRRVIGQQSELVRQRATELLGEIKRNPGANLDNVLKEGAQLCLDVLGTDLFVHVAGSIYQRVPGPGPVHQIIAELAKPQVVTTNDGVGQEQTMGWDFIFTYNFDDLMGEALLEKGLPFARMVNKGTGVYGDPSYPGLDESRDLHLKVAHLHGYTPRRMFNIEGTDFVFSMSQYLEHTQQGQRNLIIQTFQEQFVEEPLRTMLYVGCSFSDDAMNALLREAHERFPGREQFAILRLPQSPLNAEISPHELAALSEEHRQRGVEPVWVREFQEIPQVIARLK